MRMLKLLRANLALWALPLAVLLSFITLEAVAGTQFTIALGYGALFFFILETGLVERGPPLRRAGTYFLGLTVLCFGNGRLLLWFYGMDSLPKFQWIFDAGHLALLISAAFHVLELRARLAACEGERECEGKA